MFPTVRFVNGLNGVADFQFNFIGGIEQVNRARF